ncbi:MAG: APC family permease, partial [Legionellaceae bacterium]
MTQKKYALSIFSLTMLTVGSVDSIRNLPTTALFGTQLIAFFILGALCFLIPTALVSAELASGWPKQGGIYIWVKEAFGKQIGFLAIWLQWIENVIWYPTILSFVAGSIGYLIDPSLANQPYFLFGVIVTSFWGATFVNLRGMHSSALFSNICAVSGLLLPMALIIGLGAVWILGDNPVHIQFDKASLLPHVQDRSMWVSLTAIMLSFCGIEIATVHANDVENPQRAFPRALVYSVGIILSTLMFGSLAIAVVLPSNDINLVAGIMQAFDAFFGHYGLRWMMPLIALMLVMGGFGGVSNWIIAPTKGLLVAAQDGNLPLFFQRENAQGAPVIMLIGQALIVTCLSALFLFMPSVNGSYWLLTALAAQLYMLMYLL